jgi:holo-ACP synthase CitX
MSYDASKTEILAAREAQELLVRGLAAQVPGALAFVTTNIPGAEKNRPGLGELVERAIEMLSELIVGCEVIDEGSGRLGPYAGIACPDSPAAVKRAAVLVEGAVRGGRLLDVDVYDAKGRAYSRVKLGLAPRRCLVCAEPALECIRVGRHTPEELEEAVRGLIARARSG